MAAKWKIKYKNGDVTGPHSEPEIVDLIKLGRIDGTEKISTFPDGDWEPISNHSKLYDVILSTIENAFDREAQEITDVTSTRELDLNVEGDDENTDVLGEGDVSQESSLGFGNLNVSKESLKKDPLLVQPRKRLNENTDKTNYFYKAQKSKDNHVIDLKRKSSSRKKRNPMPIYFGLVFLLALYLFMQDSKDVKGPGKVSFIAPERFENTMTKPDFDRKFKRVLQFFQRDTFEDYRRAQNELVELIEVSAKQTKAMALLCLTYRELWPYSTQSTNDLSAVSTVAQKSVSLAPQSVNSSICRITNHLLSGQRERAKSIIDKSLKDSPNEPVLYEMKSHFLSAAGDNLTATAFVQKTQQLWPGWLKPYIAEAQFKERDQKYADSGRVLRKVLESYPKHTTASIELGLLEVSAFGNPKLGLELVNQGFDIGEVHPKVASRAGLKLGQFYKNSGDTSSALKWAKIGYKSDPSNLMAKDLIVELGGEKALRPLQPSDMQLIALGDNFFAEGNYLAAQAEYKAAFDQNSKNSEAALKAAKSLWKLNDTKEALSWAKKSIRSNPKYIDAYVVLSEFLSERYQFEQSVGILKRAQNISPKNHKIYRGFAKVELKRLNFSGAETYAQKALSFYDADVETHLVLSEAFYKLGKYQLAYQYTARAIELDAQSVLAQSLYGRVLATFQGVETGKEYLLDLIKTYPQILEYREALAKVHIDNGEFPQAVRVLQQIVQVYPEDKSANMLIGESYEGMNRPNDALKAYLTAALSDPTDATPLFKVGVLYMKARKFAEALDQFRKVIKVNDRFPKTYFLMGKSYLETGKLKEALESSKKEKQLNPNLADPYILAGQVYMRGRSYTDAITEFQKAVKLRPQSAQVYILMARAYRLSANYDLANSMIGKALKLENGNAEIYKEQGAIYEAQGQYAKAAMSYRSYLNLFPNAPDRSTIQSKISSLGG